MSSLHEAASEADIEKLTELIESGSDINLQDKDGNSPLSIAASCGHTVVVTWLLQHNADVHSENKKGVTALHAAARHQHEAAMDMLLRGGARLDCADHLGYTPLLIAIRRNKRNIVQFLLNNGADVHIKTDYNATPLHEAAKFSCMEIIELLVKHGACVNARDSPNISPLLNAIKYNEVQVITYLIEKGADIFYKNSEGKSLMHFAAIYNKMCSADILSGLGLDVNIIDHSNITPLYDAVYHSHVPMVEWLVEKGANILHKNCEGKSLLHLAAKHNKISCAEILISSGLDVNNTDESNITPLYDAVLEGHGYMIKCLVEKGANILRKNCEGKSLLHLAAKHNKISCAEILISSGLDVNNTDESNITPLYDAVLEGHGYLIKCLVEKGANILRKNCEGKSLLHLAAKHNKISCAEILISSGLDVNNTDESNVTPLYDAVLEGHGDMIKCLVKNRANILHSNFKGKSALHYAAKHNMISCAEILVDVRLNVNVTDEDNFTPLHAAVLEHHTEMVKTLVKRGADKSIMTNLGKTALEFARMRDFVDIINFLNI